MNEQEPGTTQTPTAAQEVGTFLVLTAIVAPLLTVAVVGGYGFLVWMYQLVAGPPGG